MKPTDQNRRQFLRNSGLTLGLGALGSAPVSLASAVGFPAPAIVASNRPGLPLALQTGDPSWDGLVVWARADRAARLIVEYSLDPDFRRPVRLTGPVATQGTDFTSRLLLRGAIPGQDYYVRAAFENTDWSRGPGPWQTGTFNLPSPVKQKPIRFLWSGDMCGQGWGINPEFGGAKIYESMRLRKPDFFIHSGDTVYADGPIASEAVAENGKVWRNIVTEEVAKVAETLREFRGRHRYNMLDANVQRFAREVPQIWQWDDHEVLNNYSAAKDLSANPAYTVKNVRLLAARGQRAFLENAPMRYYPNLPNVGFGYRDGWEHAWEGVPDRVYRQIPYGPQLDVFVLDERRYRGPNSTNLQKQESRKTAFLGNEQIDWLVAGLKKSRATWKVIASDMPIGLYVPDGTDSEGHAMWEAIANGNDGPARGRELEFARLLSRIKQARIKNVVWLTADVHYTAAHYYRPDAAVFKDFDPFWEFVSGPLNAGSFGPNALDKTFGPQLVFQKAPPVANSSPFAGYQFFGEVNIDPVDRTLTVDLRDGDGKSQFTQTLQAK